MPHRKQNPLPKHLEVKVHTLLTCFVNLRVLENILVVDILKITIIDNLPLRLYMQINTRKKSKTRCKELADTLGRRFTPSNHSCTQRWFQWTQGWCFCRNSSSSSSWCVDSPVGHARAPSGSSKRTG